MLEESYLGVSAPYESIPNSRTNDRINKYNGGGRERNELFTINHKPQTNVREGGKWNGSCK